MNDLLNNIKFRFKNANIVEQLIYINLTVYLLTFIFGIFKNDFFLNWFSLNSNFNTFINRPWSILSYGFIHYSFIHILSNLIALFYFGNLFLDYFTRKQLLNNYIWGILIGGFLFIISFNFIPFLENTNSYLIGSSAGISAILIGISTYIPNYQLHFRLIGFIKLWYIAIVWLIYNIILITANNNIGGNIAHLGGALFGLMYVNQISNKKLFFFNFLNFKKKHKPLKTVYKSSKKRTKNTINNDKQKHIDAILDKISKSGYDTLTEEEKKFLFNQGKTNV